MASNYIKYTEIADKKFIFMVRVSLAHKFDCKSCLSEKIAISDFVFADGELIKGGKSENLEKGYFIL